jgi:hypothetical protein
MRSRCVPMNKYWTLTFGLVHFLISCTFGLVHFRVLCIEGVI